jgi:hypothetical protein
VALNICRGSESTSGTLYFCLSATTSYDR